MPNHKSAKKRVRQDKKRNERNHYYKKSTRTAIRKLRQIEDKEDAQKFFRKVSSMIDRLVKKNQWHKNKGANLKSKLSKHINKIGA